MNDNYVWYCLIIQKYFLNEDYSNQYGSNFLKNSIILPIQESYLEKKVICVLPAQSP